MCLHSKYTYIDLQKQNKTAVFPALVIKTYQDAHVACAWGMVLK